MEFDTFDPASLKRNEQTKLLSGIVVPRPIAWVSTIGSAGVNLAPFSFFNAVAVDPPVVMFCISDPHSERSGTDKDTIQNLREVPEFVVHLVDEALSDQMNHTSIELPRGANEFEAAGLSQVPSTMVRPPRIGEADVHMECTVLNTIEVGKVPYYMILGEVVAFHTRKGFVNDRYHVDQDRHRPIGRLGGASLYTRTSDRFTIKDSNISFG